MYVQERVCARMTRKIRVCAKECVCAHEQENTFTCRRVIVRA